MKISFIGFGHMAKAIAQGLLSHKEHEIRAAAPSLTIGVNAEGIHSYPDNLAVIPDAQVIILAVKPNQMAQVLQQISPLLLPDCLLISVAAGLSLSWFENHINKPSPIIRAMPNITAAVSRSVTPLIGNQNVTPSQQQAAEQIFSTIGLIHWITCEEDMNRFTAFTGSGPAYLLLFMEAVSSAAVTLGLNAGMAESFALELFVGTAALAQESKESFANLRKQVTSPAGTTAAAIEVFTKAHLDELVYLAMKAAKDRARELDQ